jgi:hypothetical protein
MGRDQSDSGQFEWVNAWATSVPAMPVAVRPHVSAPVLSRAEQLARDVAEIERRRDYLDSLPIGIAPARRRFWVVPLRNDKVPSTIGGLLALVIMTVIGAAAAVTKFAR